MPRTRSIRPNPPRTFAVGDIHGHCDRLEALLRRLPLDRERDTVVFLGDYVNRGPDSRCVIDLLLELQRTCPGAVFLRGNHEQTLLDYADAGDADLLPLLRFLGVEATLRSYGVDAPHRLAGLACLPPEHAAFLRGLAFAHETPAHVFVHADPGLADDPRSEPQRLDSRRLVRRVMAPHDHIGNRTVVFGHSSFATPLVAPGRIGIDTGAGGGHMLTALELPALRFHHA